MERQKRDIWKGGYSTNPSGATCLGGGGEEANSEGDYIGDGGDGDRWADVHNDPAETRCPVLDRRTGSPSMHQYEGIIHTYSIPYILFEGDLLPIPRTRKGVTHCME